MKRIVSILTLLLIAGVILTNSNRVLAFTGTETENPYIENPYNDEYPEEPHDEEVSLIAFSDVPLDSNYAEVVYTLVEKGVLNGYPDGTFKGENTLSRAEFAAIMCRLTGLGDQEWRESIFPDVPYIHWASGYISAAQQRGYIAGYANGYFGPEDRLTYEQTVTILVRGLGYEDIAVQAGGYPYGYIQIAQNLGITDNTELKKDEPVTRFTTAILLINTLQLM